MHSAVMSSLSLEGPNCDVSDVGGSGDTSEVTSQRHPPTPPPRPGGAVQLSAS